jgi:hypothetical protein
VNSERVGSGQWAVGRLAEVGSRQSAVGRNRFFVRILFPALCLLPTAHFLTGCGDDSAANDPTQKAMQDPMHYKPEFEPRDANEGRNQQDGLGKDLDHVLNP